MVILDMQYETNQSTKLVIKTDYENRVAVISLPIQDHTKILLEIENYVGFMDFGIIKSIDIDNTTYQIMHCTLEFIENKPVLSLFVRLRVPYMDY